MAGGIIRLPPSLVEDDIICKVEKDYQSNATGGAAGGRPIYWAWSAQVGSWNLVHREPAII